MPISNAHLVPILTAWIAAGMCALAAISSRRRRRSR